MDELHIAMRINVAVVNMELCEIKKMIKKNQICAWSDKIKMRINAERLATSSKTML
jgi:hypothetical protein